MAVLASIGIQLNDPVSALQWAFGFLLTIQENCNICSIRMRNITHPMLIPSRFHFRHTISLGLYLAETGRLIECENMKPQSSWGDVPIRRGGLDPELEAEEDALLGRLAELEALRAQRAVDAGAPGSELATRQDESQVGSVLPYDSTA